MKSTPQEVAEFFLQTLEREKVDRESEENY